MTKETGGPAFPVEFIKYKTGEVGNAVPIMEKSEGITLRDYFAAKAIQELIAKYSHPNDIARHAYAIADAMLEARK